MPNSKAITGGFDENGENGRHEKRIPQRGPTSFCSLPPIRHRDSAATGSVRTGEIHDFIRLLAAGDADAFLS